MIEEKISDREGITLSVLFVFGSSLVMGSGGQAKNDSWIAVLLAILFSAPVLFMYARILYRHPGKNLYEILEDIFGKYAGKLLSLVFIWFSFHLGSLVLRNFGEFINTVGLPETPAIVPIIVFSLICVLGVKAGIETLARCSSYFITLVMVFTAVIFFFTIPKIDIENLRPVLSNGLKPVLIGAFAAFTFPFCELVIFMGVFDCLKTSKSSYTVYLKALLFGGLVICFISARNVMVLGVESLGNTYFPSYAAVSRVNIGNFIQRLEVVVAIVFILTGFMKISICLLAAAKGISRLTGIKDYRVLVTPVALLMVNFAYIIYDSIMEMFEWAEDIWPYYAFPFQVIFPFFIFAAVEIKAWLQGRKKKAKEEAPV